MIPIGMYEQVMPLDIMATRAMPLTSAVVDLAIDKVRPVALSSGSAATRIHRFRKTSPDSNAESEARPESVRGERDQLGGSTPRMGAYCLADMKYHCGTGH